MSNLRKLGSWDIAGYDQARNLQILPISQQTTFHLIAGDGLDVGVDDPQYVSVAAGDTDDKSAHKSAQLTALSPAHSGSGPGCMLKLPIVGAARTSGQMTYNEWTLTRMSAFSRLT